MDFDVDTLSDALSADQIDDVLKNEIEAMNLKIDIASSYYHTFSTPTGRKCLQHLINAFVVGPTVIPGQSPESHGIREGKKRLVFMIVQLMNMHETGEYTDVET